MKKVDIEELIYMEERKIKEKKKAGKKLNIQMKDSLHKKIGLYRTRIQLDYNRYTHRM